MRSLLALALLLAACGATTTAPPSEPANPPEPARVDEPAREPIATAEEDEGGLACASDAECVVGGPDRCCASSGAECRQAWSRTALEAFRAGCEARTCDRVISLVCSGNGIEGDVEAVCVRARCELRAVSR